MQVSFNPKDNNTFASASLDRTIKVMNWGSEVFWLAMCVTAR
jgi:coatomer subunit beta'